MERLARVVSTAVGVEDLGYVVVAVPVDSQVVGTGCKIRAAIEFNKVAQGVKNVGAVRVGGAADPCMK